MRSMQLRDSSMRRVPGRYQEDLGPSRADRPIFAHPDVPFNAALVQHCAHPSLPLNYPGVGPSEAERARLQALAAAEQAEINGDREEQELADGEGSSAGATSDQDSEDADSDAGSVFEVWTRRPRGVRAARQEQAGPSLNSMIDDLTISEPALRTVGHQVGQEVSDQEVSDQEESDESPLAAAEPTPTTADTTPAPPTRPAYVAKIPRRKPGQKPADAGENTDHGNTALRPTWADLSDGIKFAIAHDTTRTAPLSQAVQSLDLGHVEVASLLGLITEEAEKAQGFAALLAQHHDGAGAPAAEELAALSPITEGIAAREVRRGQAFLRSLGMGDVAAGLGFWEGTGGDFHEVQIDEVCRDLVGGSDHSAGGEGGSCGSTGVQNLAGEAEFLPRPDLPAGTIDPQQLVSGARPVRAEGLELVRVPRSLGLHPANYAVGGNSGRRYSALDESEWPAWEALHDDGLVAEDALAIYTAHSLVSRETTFLSAEELAVVDAARPAEMLGSAPVPDPDDLDYEVNHLLPPANGFSFQHQAGEGSYPYPYAPGNGYSNPFEGDYALDMFADSPLAPAAPADELGSSQTVDEEQALRGAAVAGDADCDMVDVSAEAASEQIPAPPNPSLGPSEVHQPVPAEQLDPAEMDPNLLAIERFVNAPRPIIRQLNPELAASAAEITARLAREARRVHFEDELPLPSAPRRQAPTQEPEYVLEDEEDDSAILDSGRGPRSRVDDAGDGDWNPPRTRAPRGPRASRATASAPRKRARTQSPAADQPTPAAPTSESAADNAATKTKRGRGRPPRKKSPVPDPASQAPADPAPSPTPSMTAASMLSTQGEEQFAIPQPSTAEPGPTSSIGGPMERLTTPVPSDGLEDPFVDAPSADLPSTEPSPPAEPAPQEQKKSRSRKMSEDNDEDYAEPAPKRRRKKAEPKLDDNGQPIKPPRGRPRTGPPYSVDANKMMRSSEGEEMTRLQLEQAFTPAERKYLPGGKIGGGRFEIIATGVIWSFLPETQAQIDKENKAVSRRGNADRSNKNRGSGTGVNASKTQAEDTGQQDAAPTTPAKPTALSGPAAQLSLTPAKSLGLSPPVGKSKQRTLVGIIRPNAPAHIALPPQPIGPPATTVPVTPGTTTAAPAPPAPAPAPAPAAAPRPRAPRSRATQPRGPRAPRAPRTSGTAAPRSRAPRPNPAPPTTTTTATAPAVPAPAAPPLPSANPAVAARVAELNMRCSRYNVPTRDRFDTDAEFLTHAEGMLPLLYPKLGGGGGGAPPAPAPGPARGGYDSFI
ncbi:hypothetical protein C8A01DRAFT_34057 [Parachaetomium inaequale]|uniref:Uncharacterized protein n=1 Tax=Parachaetomium inaequale TaxID=2588326 RepID=A0AAN6STV2_9PEZI|nr:hypothetical protein C8A01DRAFT_34057 [Parachaetomium inaequale]